MNGNDLEAVERSLLRNPHDHEALATAYRVGEADPKAYVALLERVGLGSTDPQVGAHFLSEGAAAALASLADAHRAAGLLMQAINRDPTHKVSAERLATLYRERGDARALIALHERRAKVLAPLADADGALRIDLATLHEELGRLWLESQANPKKGLEHFRRAYELDPTCVFAIYSARELLLANGQTDEALATYALEVAAEPDPARQVSLLREEATLRRNSGDLVTATHVLIRAREIDSTHPDLLVELSSVVRERLNGTESKKPTHIERSQAADALATLAERAPDEDALGLLAEALAISPGDDRALAAYAELSVRLGDGADLAERYLAYVTANPYGAFAEEARALLSESYDAAGEHDSAEAMRAASPPEEDAEMWVATIEPPGPLDPADIAPTLIPGRPDEPWLETMAKLSSPSESASLVSRAPSQPDLPPAGTPRTDPPRFATIPPGEVRDTLDRAVEKRHEGDTSSALALYLEVLSADPCHAEALAFAEDELRARREYATLRDVLARVVHAMSGTPEGTEAKIERLRQLAVLCEMQLKDPAGAVDANKQILAIDPGDKSARATLVRLLASLGRDAELGRALEVMAASQADPGERRALDERAAEAFRRAGDLRSFAEAMERVACSDEFDTARANAAVSAYEEAGAFAEAARVLELCVQSTPDNTVRAAVWDRIASLRANAGDIAAAQDAADRATNLEPTPGRHASFAKLCDRGARYADAATSYSSAAELADVTAEKVEFWALAASAFEHASAWEKARAACQTALLLDPGREDLEARLERLAEETGDPETLVQTLEERARAVVDPQKKLSLLARAADAAWERLGDELRAVELWKQAVTFGENEEILARLADLSESAGQFAESAAYLERLAAEQKTAEGRIAHLLRAAGLLENRAHDLDEALRVYEQIHSLAPKHQGALKGVSRLREQCGDSDGAARALEIELGELEGSDRQPIALRLSALLEQLGRVGDALKVISAELDRDADLLELLPVACDLAEKADDPDALARFLARRVEAEADDAEASALGLRLANVLVERLERKDDALAVLAEAGDLGSEEARDQYVALGDALGWTGIVASKLVDWYFESPADPVRTAKLHMAFERLVGVGRKIDALTLAKDLLVEPAAGDNAPVFYETIEALALEQRDLSTLRLVQGRMIDSASPASQPAEYVRQATVLRRAGVSESDSLAHGALALANAMPEQAVTLIAELSELTEQNDLLVSLYQQHAKEIADPATRARMLVHGAAKCIRKGASTPAATILTMAMGDGADPELTVQAFSTELASLEGPTFRSDLISAARAAGRAAREDSLANARVVSETLCGLSEVWTRGGGDRDAAFALLEEALLAHTTARVLASLRELGSHEGDGGRVDEVLSRALKEVFEGTEVRLLLAARAAHRRDALGDVSGAVADYKRLMQLTPGDTDVGGEIEALLLKDGDVHAIVKFYDEQMRRTKSPDAKLALARKVAHLWADSIGDPREAADAWRTVLRLAPGDSEAQSRLEQAKVNIRLGASPRAVPAEGEAARDVPSTLTPAHGQPVATALGTTQRAPQATDSMRPLAKTIETDAHSVEARSAPDSAPRPIVEDRPTKPDLGHDDPTNPGVTPDDGVALPPIFPRVEPTSEPTSPARPVLAFDSAGESAPSPLSDEPLEDTVDLLSTDESPAILSLEATAPAAVPAPPPPLPPAALSSRPPPPLPPAALSSRPPPPLPPAVLSSRPPPPPPPPRTASAAVPTRSSFPPGPNAITRRVLPPPPPSSRGIIAARPAESASSTPRDLPKPPDSHSDVIQLEELDELEMTDKKPARTPPPPPPPSRRV